MELRAVTEDEWPAFVRTVEACFGAHVHDGDEDRYRRLHDGSFERTIAGVEDGRIVATAAAFSFTLTVPGGTVPAAGVTAVGVLPTHRRQGLLRRMMDHQLDDVARRGEPIAVLTASESLIYGRFGYGVASYEQSWSIEAAHAAQLRPPQVDGRIRLVSAEELRPLAPELFAASTAGVPGVPARSDAWWDIWFEDPEPWREQGAAARFYAHHEGGGYAAWRITDSWDRELPRNVATVEELHAADPEVEADLFRFLCELDLVHQVKAPGRPVDDQLRWRLADARRMVVDAVQDSLYVRVLDPEAALAARRYRVEDTLVLELTDPFRPANDGRWLAGAEAGRTDRPADLALSAVELGSLYLGGVDATALARAGRIEERTPGALARADALFAWDRRPWLTHGF